MINHRLNFLIVLLGLLSLSSYGQDNFNIEVYGGPSYSYFNSEIISPQSNVTLSSNISPHLGINLLKKVAPSYQVSLQAEYLIRYVRYQEIGPDFSFDNNRNSFQNKFGNFSLGLRRVWEKEKYNVFLQGSLGVVMDREPRSFFSSGNLPPEPTKTNFSPIGRIEAGIQYPIKNNYLILGIRHQQGFNNFENLGYESGSQQLYLTGSGSYTGLFVGFGFNTDTWFRKK
ncbi:hypothetical protein [Pararhodonellum marinum]|uniref:hypothetical protein n=1 Tax=Pararhodonellum marinum TaxID=2755358 RepID=UPI00188FC0CE|nr:hypothetical protein [Pararhodonellum marinum]